MIQLVSFEKARKFVFNEIFKSDSLSNNEIYDVAFNIYRNHSLVKAFLLNEGYTSTQIARSKHEFTKKRKSER